MMMLEGQIGCVAEGAFADLVVVDGDPLADITSTRKVRRVIANGRVYELNQLINLRPAPMTP